MLKDAVTLLFGLAILVSGGEFLVRGATSMALRMRISRLVVGLTIVAFGTSAPELFVSIQSALSGSPDLTMGNVIGSNICNLALVLGVTAVIFPVQVHTDSIRIDWPVVMGSSVLLYLLVLGNLISSVEGLLFIILLVVYTVFIIKRSRRKTREVQNLQNLDADSEIPETPSAHLWKDILFIVLGTVGLAIGSDLLVKASQSLALQLGITERIIGITLLALGTSLPELITSVIASFKKQTDIAFGNLIGSNIFNILSILGITSLIRSIPVNDIIIHTDIIWMLGITFLILPMMLYKRRIGRLEGATLLVIYLLYIYQVITSG